MRNKILILFLSLFSVLLNAQSSKEQKLDSIFTMMYQQNQFNGTVLIADKGKIIFEKAYGLRDEKLKKDNTINTEFELASCSKQFTSAAIMLLNRQGKLTYNDKLSTYIPELSFWNEVTISDLLRHTSGLPEYLIDLSGSWKSKGIANNKDLIAFYAQRRDTLQFRAGSRHRYNNTNYVILATIVERISGMDYALYLKNNIFKPLGMKHTFVYNRRQQPQKRKNNAIGYVWAKNSFDKVTMEDTKYGDSMSYTLDGIVGTAKVNATVRDLYKWINALKSNTFFTKAEFEVMTAISKTTDGRNVPYGFGLDVAKSEQSFSFGHTGSWDGFSTFIYHSMTKDRTIITLQNFKMGAYPYQNINEILDNKPLTVEYRKKINLSETNIKKWIGTYIDPSNENEVQYITYLNGYLVHNSKRVNWDMRFFPVTNNEFMGVRQGGADGILKFSVLENGDIQLKMTEYGESVGIGVKNKIN